MSSKTKGKEKILINEESTTKKQRDINVAIEEAIRRTARTTEEKKSLQELIASIIAE